MPDLAYTIPIQRVEAFVRLGTHRDWNVDAVLRSAGVSPMLLKQGRSRVTSEQVSALSTALWRVTGDELLGLGTAPVPPGSLRLLSYALAGAGDVRTAFAWFRDFRRALPGLPPIRLASDHAVTTLSIDIGAISRPVDLAEDILLAATHRVLSWATRSRVRLHRVEVPHPELPNVDDYDVIFGAPVTFSAPAPALVFDSMVLAAPIMRSHNDIDDFLRNAPVEILSRRDYGVSLSDRVRRILEHGLTGDWPNANYIATRVAMSPQTLRRKLREQHTSITQIKEDILRDAAIASLTGSRETVTALSERLGFSEPSAFSRAFRRWTGSPPGAYRSR